MNTAMSTKRMYIDPARPTPKTGSWGSPLAVPALIGGFLVMLLGFAIDVGLVALVGFVVFIGAFMYLNITYWGNIYKDKDIKEIAKERENYWI